MSPMLAPSNHFTREPPSSLLSDRMAALGYELPPGFRFHPTDQELITHYLKKKISSSLSPATSIIADIDLYKFNPWDLPNKAFFGEGEWFFFTSRDRKYPKGARPNRAAGSGYWKATGTDKPILASGSSQCLGVKKALVFYRGRPPKGVKTDWVMHEYRLLDAIPACPQNNRSSMRLDDWVLCRVRQRNGPPLQACEEHLSSSPVATLSNPSVRKQGMKREMSDLFEGTHYQLLGYLLSLQDEGDSVCENSDLTSNQNYGQGDGANPVEEAQQPLDDLLMLPPNKVLHCDDVALDLFWPVGSYSVEQTCPDFLV